jgi:Subtilase family
MLPINRPFPHLSLVLRYDGSARFPQVKIPPTLRTKTAQEDRTAHSGGLSTTASKVSTDWKVRVSAREQDNLPVLPKDIPLLLEVDTMLDLEELGKLFGFELISEEEDGFVIVASEDIDLNALLKRLTDFTGGVTGSAAVAKIHKLHEDADQTLRLSRILSERLQAIWPHLNDNGDYIVDVGVACAGKIQIPNRPKEPTRGGPESEESWAKRQASYSERLREWEVARDAPRDPNADPGTTRVPRRPNSPTPRRERESDEAWARRQAKYAASFNEWNTARVAAYDAWDALADERTQQVYGFVQAYGGDVIGIFADPEAGAKLAEDFTLRVKINGKGLRDLVLNYPFLFEVVEPDEIELPQASREAIERARGEITFDPPPVNAPAVCVIDSGIQEGHYLIESAIDSDSSWCLLPDESPTNVSDFVRPGGHGTRVAGAILFGESIPQTGTHQFSWWIQNARVLDEHTSLPDRLFPPAMLRAVVNRFYNGEKRTRIYNHSIASGTPCRLRHMSAWAAEIDFLSFRNDILIVVSSGNLRTSGSPSIPGIQEHLSAGRQYPAYLCEPASRVANPAQSLQALTVGSIGYGEFEDSDWRSFARTLGHPSSFSRGGLGIWKSIKPEVVEFGGDNLTSHAAPHDVGTPACGREMYPELVRSTMYPPGPAYDRDSVGTSFAAPKVTRIAARLQEVLPDESCLLYRALIVQSARWPEWTREEPSENHFDVIRWIGYGLPDIERATSNTEYRTTLITSGDKSISAGGCHVYQIPIPPELRRPGYDFDVLIEVTLSYAAEPRRTRRNRRRYLSTWVDWKSSNKDEPLDRFRNRALKTEEDAEEAGESFHWTIGTRTNQGDVRDVSRNAGTVQKDWTVVKSGSLPEDFCIAVVGHQGWSTDPESTATYALTVSIEVLGKQVQIYDHIRIANDELRVEVESEAEVDVEVFG